MKYCAKKKFETCDGCNLKQTANYDCRDNHIRRDVSMSAERRDILLLTEERKVCLHAMRYAQNVPLIFNVAQKRKKEIDKKVVSLGGGYYCMKCRQETDSISEYGICNKCTLSCHHDMAHDYGSGRNEMALPYGRTCTKCGHFEN